MSEEEKKEYIVTLWKHEDLNDFYETMESSSGDTVIPKRTVECIHKRPISRNTHYLLTEEEANDLKKDSRVRDARTELTQDEKKLCWQLDSTASFPRMPAQNSQNYQWGLIAHSMHDGGIGGSFGITDTSGHPNQILNTNGQDGLGVDVVIADGTLDNNHPEFRENADGTGSIRANRYDWSYNCSPTTWVGSGVQNYYYPSRGLNYIGISMFADDYDSDNSGKEHAIGVDGTNDFYFYADGRYDYMDTSYVIADNGNHASHVASTAAGNRQGWAKKANIYNINPLDTGDNDNGSYDSRIHYNLTDSIIFDLVRDMHKQKLNSTVHGTIQSPMPTIVNNSWHPVQNFNFEQGITYYINFRGTVESFTRPWWDGSAWQPGSASDGSVFTNVYQWEDWLYDKRMGDKYSDYAISNYVWQGTARVSYWDSDFEDMVYEGIIVVSAANNYGNIYTSDPNDPDYNNWVADNSSGINATYYNRGGSIMHYPDSILTVGSLEAISPTGNNPSNNLPYMEQLSTFSTSGPRVDVYAAGTDIIGAFNGGARNRLQNVWIDPDFRNSNMPNNGRSWNWGNTVPVSNHTQGTDGVGNTALIACGHTDASGEHADPYTQANIPIVSRGNTGAYYQQKYISGTSMASPQATGVLSLALEKYRNFNAEDAKKYIHSYSQKDRIPDSDGSGNDRNGLNGAPNNFLMFHMERRQFGMITPEVDYSYRRQKEDKNNPYLPQISTATYQPGLKWPRVPRYMTKKFRNIHYFPIHNGGDIADPTNWQYGGSGP